MWVPDGDLLFSDPNANTIYRWTPDGQVSVFRTRADTPAWTWASTAAGLQRSHARCRRALTIDEHGNRRVVRIEKTGAVTVLADRFEGKRLEQPQRSGLSIGRDLFFTDPPFGLPKAFDDPRKELPFSGVFSLKDGMLQPGHRAI